MANPFSTYGRLAHVLGTGLGAGKTFLLVGTSDTNISEIQQRFPVDEDGVVRVYTDATEAIGATVANRGDVIQVAPSFTTALTAAQLLSAETKGVSFVPANGVSAGGVQTTFRATAALPQTTAHALFTITGRIKMEAIIGEVTTIIQTQVNNTKLAANPTVGAGVDICAVLDISADAVGTNYFITGTFATAMQDSASATGVYQAAPTLLSAGTLDLDCAASNTGAVKWLMRWVPIDPGARVIAA